MKQFLDILGAWRRCRHKNVIELNVKW